jgi:hypothetical protein
MRYKSFKELATVFHSSTNNYYMNKEHHVRPFEAISNPYDQGYKAGYELAEILTNPYHIRDQAKEHMEWIKGYHAGYDNSKTHNA